MPATRPARRSVRRLEISPAAYRRITVVALVALGAIIVTGAAVRLTGSGMGCPTWPSCEDGSLVPRGATGEHGWIEFGNRLITGAVSVAVALAVLGSHWRKPYRRDLSAWSWGLVAGVFAQALLGGLVVFLHVAPVAVAGHYLLSAVLVWNGVVLHHRAARPDGHRTDPVPASVVRRSRTLVVLAGVVLVTGTLVTGSGPHGGDEAADRLPFAVVTVARIHSVAVWAFLAVVAAIMVRLAKAGGARTVVARGQVLLAVVVAQGALGYLQYFTGVPEILVGGHVLGSVLVWVAALRFHLAWTQPLPTESIPPARPEMVEAVTG